MRTGQEMRLAIIGRLSESSATLFDLFEEVDCSEDDKYELAADLKLLINQGVIAFNNETNTCSLTSKARDEIADSVDTGGFYHGLTQEEWAPEFRRNDNGFSSGNLGLESVCRLCRNKKLFIPGMGITRCTNPNCASS